MAYTRYGVRFEGGDTIDCETCGQEKPKAGSHLLGWPLGFECADCKKIKAAGDEAFLALFFGDDDEAWAEEVGA